LSTNKTQVPQYVLVPLSAVPQTSALPPPKTNLEKTLFSGKLRAFAREDVFTRGSSRLPPEMRYGRFIQDCLSEEKQKSTRLGRMLRKDQPEAEGRLHEVRDGFDAATASTYGPGFKIFFPADREMGAPKFNPEGRMFKLLQLPLMIVG
jgi:hypothetical protein